VGENQLICTIQPNMDTPKSPDKPKSKLHTRFRFGKRDFTPAFQAEQQALWLNRSLSIRTLFEVESISTQT
jgi:hypothetical protein